MTVSNIRVCRLSDCAGKELLQVDGMLTVAWRLPGILRSTWRSVVEELRGRVAIVTGGGRGVGRGIVLELASRGVRVVVNDIYRDQAGMAAADAVVGEVTSAEGEAYPNYEDISEWAGGERLVEAAISRFGRVDILVTCAGNASFPTLLEVSEEEWDRTVAIHLKGHSGCARAAAKRMIEQGDGGRIVMFSSRSSFFSGKAAAYTAAKAAIMGMAGQLARELAPHHITVNCILPNAETQLAPIADPVRRVYGGTPPSSDLRPEAIAPVVAYLASPYAEHLTGKFVYASGGDVCFYKAPLVLSGDTLLRKQGRWTVEELAELVPPIVGNN
jgi:NAD(P)-dependent dehydrogenase (short-subunit alcohol dehydrogenase family)